MPAVTASQIESDTMYVGINTGTGASEALAKGETAKKANAEMRIAASDKRISWRPEGLVETNAQRWFVTLVFVVGLLVGYCRLPKS